MIIDWRRFFSKLRNFLWPGRAERDLTREIESHLQLLRDDYLCQGMSASEAHLAARRAYGGVEQAKELHREERSWIWLEHLRQDIRFSIRTLSKSPAFSLTAIATLALGIGANTAIFSLIDSIMLKTLPVSHPEQLLQVNLANEDLWGRNTPYLSNPVWEQLRDRQDVFSGLFAYAVGHFNLAPRGEVRYVQGNYVSGQFFDALGLRPAVGRNLAPPDDRRGCAGTAVLSYGFWQSEYGGRAGIIGKSIMLDNHPFAIVGVIGPGFNGVDVGRESDIYVPLCAERIINGEHSSLDARNAAWLRVIGRAKPGISASQVEARLKTLAGPIFEATMPSDLRPDQRETYRKRAFRVETAANGPSLIRSKYRQALFVLMAITAVVLLIACANLANLFLARGAARQREIAIRMALGSGRGRLMRQLLAESMLLSLGGALLGIVFAHWGAQFLVSFLSSSVYQENKVFLDLSIDPRVLAFTIGVAILTSLLFGLVPASRAARVNPQSAMKANSRGLSKDGKLGLGKTLVIAQISLSLVLVAGAGLLLATLRQLEALDPGFDRNNVLLIGVTLPSNTGTPDRNRAIFDEMLSRLRALVGVRSASYSDITPVGDAIDADILQFENNAGRSNPPALVFFNLVSDGYFETLGTPLLSGRDFNARDTPRSPKVAIVNETLSKKFFQGQNPIGKYYRELRGAKLGDPIAIIGVARDAKYANLREPVPPTVYIAARQEARTRSEATFELQAAGGSPASLISAAKSCMEHVDGDASLQFKTLAAQVGRSLSRERLLAALSGFFGGLALLLATIGLYGVTSYNIARRRGEIGIRMALGATESRVLHIVLGEVAILVAVGLVIGFALSLGATRLIASFLYGVKADDPVTLSLAAAVLSLVATIAGFLPARRASRLDPMASLREE